MKHQHFPFCWMWILPILIHLNIFSLIEDKIILKCYLQHKPVWKLILSKLQCHAVNCKEWLNQSLSVCHYVTMVLHTGYKDLTLEAGSFYIIHVALHESTAKITNISCYMQHFNITKSYPYWGWNIRINTANKNPTTRKIVSSYRTLNWR